MDKERRFDQHLNIKIIRTLARRRRRLMVVFRSLSTGVALMSCRICYAMAVKKKKNEIKFFIHIY